MWNLAACLLMILHVIQGRTHAHVVSGQHYHSRASELERTLLTGYDKGQIPLERYGEAVRLDLTFVLVDLVEVNEAKDVMELNGWIDLRWTDHRLSWDNKNGLNRTLISADKIWLPDLTLYKSSGHVFPIDGVRHNVAVSPTGLINAWTPIRPRFSCKFPAEETADSVHHCSLEFGSWTYNGFMLDLHVPEGVETIKLDHYTMNKNWELLSTKAERIEKSYDCCPDTLYTSVRFTIDFKHRAGV